MRFFYQNHLSRSAFQQLLKLIDIHLPEKKLCETSVNKIKEKVGFHGSYFQCHEYCDNCGGLYPNGKLIHQCTTPRCTGMRCDTKDGKSNYFVSGDMRTQKKFLKMKKTGMKLHPLYNVQKRMKYMTSWMEGSIKS